LDDYDAEVQCELGWLAYKTSDHQTARAALEKALELELGELVAQLQLGLVLLACGDSQGARDVYARAAQAFEEVDFVRACELPRFAISDVDELGRSRADLAEPGADIRAILDLLYQRRSDSVSSQSEPD
jgi:hypothetical protein